MRASTNHSSETNNSAGVPPAPPEAHQSAGAGADETSLRRARDFLNSANNGYSYASCVPDDLKIAADELVARKEYRKAWVKDGRGQRVSAYFTLKAAAICVPTHAISASEFPHYYTAYAWLPRPVKLAIERLDADDSLRTASMLDELISSYASICGESVDPHSRQSAQVICARRFGETFRPFAIEG